MRPSPPAGPPRIRRARLRRVAVLLLLGALLGGAAGWLWGAGRAATHEATAVVVVNPLEGNPFSPDGRGDDLVNLATEAQLVRSSTMGALVSRSLATGDLPEELVDAVSVSVPPNTQLLEITASAATDELAARRAQAFAETYLEYRAARTEAARFDRAAQLTEQVQEQTRERDELAEELAEAPVGSGEVAVLTQRVVNATTQIDELRSQLAANDATAPDPGQLVTPAATSSRGLPGGPATAAGLGLVLGAALGWLTAAAAARLDGVARDPDDLAAATVPALAAMPYVADRADVARLRAALLAATDRRPLTVVVSAAAPAAGGARTGFGLARSLADAHLRTVLVDLTAAATPGPGLSDVLTGSVGPEAALEEETAHLGRLGVGTRPALLDDLVASLELSVVLAELRDRSDVVLLCCPGPEDQVTQALVSHGDLVLLEVHQGHTRLVDLDAAATLVRSVGGTEVRTVLVGPAPRHRRPHGRRGRVVPRVGAPSWLRRGLARTVLGPLASDRAGIERLSTLEVGRE